MHKGPVSIPIAGHGVAEPGGGSIFLFAPESVPSLSLHICVWFYKRHWGTVRVSLHNGMLLHSSPMGHLACGSIFHSTQIPLWASVLFPSCHMASSKGSQTSVT